MIRYSALHNPYNTRTLSLTVTLDLIDQCNGSLIACIGRQFLTKRFGACSGHGTFDWPQLNCACNYGFNSNPKLCMTLPAGLCCPQCPPGLEGLPLRVQRLFSHELDCRRRVDMFDCRPQVCLLRAFMSVNVNLLLFTAQILPHCNGVSQVVISKQLTFLVLQ